MKSFPKYLKVLMSVTFLMFCAVYASETQGLTHFGLFESLASVGGTTTMLGACFSVGSIEEEECGPNSGGIYELYVIAKRDIGSFPPLKADSTVELVGNIVPKDGKAWAKWDFSEETGEITYKSTGDAGSQAFEQALAVFIPGSTPKITDIVNKALNGSYVVAVVDPAGQIRIGGTDKRGMTFNIDHKSGKKSLDKNGGDYTFACGIGHPPLFYTGTLPLVAAPVV